MNKKTKFVDLFAGIGGFHLSFKELGAKCVFACENNNQARMTYQSNFDMPEDNFHKDIRTLDTDTMPDFDVLCAGFPCQAFSTAGNRKGFADNSKDEKGQMFFYLLDIIKKKKPKALFLENVRGILTIDNGETFKTIESLLKKEGYSFYYKLVRTCDYGLPQLRPRVFMVGFLDDNKGNFEFPEHIPLKMTMSDVWQGNCTKEIGYTLMSSFQNKVMRKSNPWDLYFVDGQERRIGLEQARLMQGFPADFKFPVPHNRAVRQLGNSVSIPPVQMTAEKILDYLKEVE